ncbi:MAG: hypothetical protein IJ461_07700 [Clostridia bacterium]|nr:hypothetical protein [Clostridia bacterium]
MIEPATGKTKVIAYEDHTILFCYQSNPGWTHPYYYENGDENLSDAGCGIFSLCHAVEWMHGIRLSAEEMADFSMANGGRGDDGTDRPGLLHGLMVTGMGKKIGLEYREDGLRNDLDALWEHMSTGKGTAFCNLRVGHIVAIVDARIVNGEKQLLVIDSVAESSRDMVRNHVREVIPQSLVIRHYKNKQGLYVGQEHRYAMFWVTADLPKDFNLIYKVEPERVNASK